MGDAQAEGDVWDHNFSLTEDGVVNSKLAYRNPSVSTLMNNLPAKLAGGKVEMKDVNYLGKFQVVEAGDGVDHDTFEEILEEQHDYLSSDKTLFFEDFGLGTMASTRVGARMISDNPIHALIFRSLMIKIPPRPTDHRARYNGWNFDERWEVTDFNWDGEKFDFVTKQVIPRKGERPIIAFIGGKTPDSIAVQFVKQAGERDAMGGANIVASGGSSIRGVIDAYGQAAAAMMNDEVANSITLPCTISSNGKQTVLFEGSLSDSFLNKIHEKGSLYGAYYNTIHDKGVSAVFGGFIGPAKAIPTVNKEAFNAQSSPVVVSGDLSTISLSPDNAVNFPSTVVFVDKSAPHSLSLDDAVARLVENCGDDTKASDIRKILEKAKIVVVKSEKEAEKYVV